MKFKIFISLLFTSFMIKAQIGIGTKSPDPSSMLDINVKNLPKNEKKGILIPRVSLKSYLDKETIPSPAEGLLIYNEGEVAGFTNKGFYFWAGSEWRSIDGSSAAEPQIEELKCNNAYLTPSNYEKDVEFTGILTVPYTNGNGAKYSVNNLSDTENGLKYQLLGGKLGFGDGDLYYKITGTPKVSSPNETIFPISFDSKSCNAKVGNQSDFKVMQYNKVTSSPLNNDTPNNSIATLGNILVRYNAISEGRNNLEFSVKKSTHVSFLYQKSGEGGINLQNYGRKFSIPDNWYDLTSYVPASGNTSSDLNSSSRDIGTVIIILHNLKEIYRVTVNANGTISKETTSGVTIPEAPSAVTIFIEKLD